MPRFELTARFDLCQNGLYVSKGTPISVNIPMMGVLPGNLFSNSRCKEALLQQFAINGLNLPPNSSWLNGSHWDVKLVK